VAVKIFNETAISRGLLEKMTQRLEAGGWPAGVLPVLAAEFGGSPALRVTPLRADAQENEGLVPRSLQHRLDDYPGLDSWKLVRALARALAGMHERGVAHGNLKPGNVLFDEQGEVLLTDWTLGNMPGVTQVEFTDAVLYQAPEQLKDPAGYLDEAGYRWDVFAFGVLAFRVLTGRFPRCHETYAQVAPPPGETRRDGLKADLVKIATILEAQTDAAWPDEVRNPLERGFREWIERCLALDPVKRPATMMAVAAAFEAVEQEVAAAKDREVLLDQRRKAERCVWGSLFGLGAVAAVAMVFAGLWQHAGSQLAAERGTRQDKVRTLRVSSEEARVAQAAAENRIAQAEQTLANERELGVDRLEASRLIGDHLFAWAMEQGHRLLPPLDGRELRLKLLERYFEDFLTRSAHLDALADERTRVRLQLAEVSLAAGDVSGAARRLAEALPASSELPMDGALKLRVASDWLWLALLRQSRSDPATEAAFAAARKALAEVPRPVVDAERLDQLGAILDFHEAQVLAARGRDSKALEQMMRATQTLNRIAEQRPDAAILRSELVDCYLASATILEDQGNPGDACEVRTLAAASLTKLLRDRPGDLALRSDLAGCYGAMAEAAVLSGDVAGAESLSLAALELLDALLREHPDHAVAVSRKAGQLGLRAGIQRDRGFTAEALAGYDEGIRMLEALRASAPDQAMVAYRLALLWWQKGRMLGMAGKRDEEIVLLGKARESLERLESGRSASGPSSEHLQRSVAYLLGDCGHALQLADRKDDAVRAFAEAVARWQRLCEARPRSEEYSEGLNWCRQRVADLK
jgi:tetratricopeptide (TPR) repeat protein